MQLVLSNGAATWFVGFFLTEIMSLMPVASRLQHSPRVVASVGSTCAEGAAVGWVSNGNAAHQLDQHQNVSATAQSIQYEDRLIDISYIYLQLACIEGNICVPLNATSLCYV